MLGVVGLALGCLLSPKTKKKKANRNAARRTFRGKRGCGASIIFGHRSVRENSTKRTAKVERFYRPLCLGGGGGGGESFVVSSRSELKINTVAQENSLERKKRNRDVKNTRQQRLERTCDLSLSLSHCLKNVSFRALLIALASL
jgi:hypothetical protein